MTPETKQSRSIHPAWYLAMTLALAGNVGLFLYGRSLATSLTDLRASTKVQVAELTQQLEARSVASKERAVTAQQAARDDADNAQKKLLLEARRTATALSARLKEATDSQQQMAGDLYTLRSAQTTADSKIDQMGGDLSGVKGDLVAAKSDVEGHTTELKRVSGDMGVMGGAIATNAKELAALRELGERNYTEFKLKRKTVPTTVAGIKLALTKADVKRNRFTLDVTADDKHVEKRDRTINEPVQLYVSSYRQPVEIVVNQVDKDQVTGYIAVPKVQVARK